MLRRSCGGGRVGICNRRGWNLSNLDSLGGTVLFQIECITNDKKRGAVVSLAHHDWMANSDLRMRCDSAPLSGLAPLQRVMLRDSWAEEDAGHHVEQVELVISPGIWRTRVLAAWQETVARTEVLGVSFLMTDQEFSGIEFVEPRSISIQSEAPVAWETWLAADRRQSLLIPNEVPWRVTYWPAFGHFIWTFHHALLDGRSIAAILRGFMARVAGDATEDLKLSRWHPPAVAEIDLAARMFLEEPTCLLADACGFLEDVSSGGEAVRHLGGDFKGQLESKAHSIDISIATILIWAWGQALAGILGRDAVMVEQVRSGAPQPGTAGFKMLTLPVTIHRYNEEDYDKPLRKFRTRLLELREIEGVSPGDFDHGVYPDSNHPQSSVIMVEQATLGHLIQGEMVESLELHENKGESLMATAHILPDLRLEVEGPGRLESLEAWVGVLECLTGLHSVKE